MAILTGLGKDEIPTNGDLGSLAYQNQNEVEIDNGRAALDEYQKAYSAPKIKPTLNLPFAKMQTFDPRVTFTRASDAYAYEGDSQKAEENLVLFSEQFDSGSWVKTSATVLANQTVSPDGKTTADSLQMTGQGQVTQGVTSIANSAHTLSIFVKSSASGFLRLICGGVGGSFFGLWFDYANGTVGTTDASGGGVNLGSGVVAYPDGWYRVYLTGTNTSTNYTPLFYLTDADNTSTRSTTAVAFIWGAQLEQRSTLTDYQRTTDRIIQRYVDVYSLVTTNKPRFKEIDPITKERKGLLVEEARTNLLLQSNGFGTADWLKEGATVEVGVPSPVGLGFKIVESDLNQTHQIRTSTSAIPVGTTRATLYVKAAGAKNRALILGGGNNASAGGGSTAFDLETGKVIVDTNLNSAPSFERFDNGWLRISVTFVTTVASQVFLIRFYNTELATSLYQGDGYSGIYISQAQLEVGSFATSPILTTAAQVTRASDRARVLNFTDFYSAGSVSIFADAYYGFPSNQSRIIGGLGASALLFDTSSTGLDSSGYSTVATLTAGGNRPQERNRGALSLDGETINLVSNGEFFASDKRLVGAYPIEINIGHSGNLNDHMNGHMVSVQAYPQALTADELAFLTRNTADE